MTEAANLIPIKLEALVVEDGTINGFDIVRDAATGKVRAGDGKWTPQGSNLKKTLRNLDQVGPKLFFGAKPHGSVLGFKKHRAAPSKQDRGVYLHWLLPPGMRHGGTDLDFPKLPDQWVIVRYARLKDQPASVKAWFLDSGVEGDGEANLIVKGQDHKRRMEHQVRSQGRVIPLADYLAGEEERGPITTLGNETTNSRWFTAFTADNRNCLSYFDSLEDVREGDAGKLPKDLAVSYQLVGWYADNDWDPLASVGANDLQQSVQDLQWQLDNPASGRCYFHGLLGHINFWNPKTYLGPMLGYPGAPSEHGGYRPKQPPLKVGFGFSLEQALAALVADRDQRAGPQLWQALEAVAYRQPQTLLEGADPVPLEQAKERTAFRTRDGGITWTILGGEMAGAGHVPGVTQSEQAIRPTVKQSRSLAGLNELQRKADGLARRMVGYQQDYYFNWWRLLRAQRFQFMDAWRQQEEICTKLRDQIKRVQRDFSELAAQIRESHRVLNQSLQVSDLRLEGLPAPRFHGPVDPVLMVANYGKGGKHGFTNPWPCRSLDDLLTETKIVVDNQTVEPAAVMVLDKPDAKVLQQSLPGIVGQLIDEGSRLEAALTAMATASLPGAGFNNKGQWQRWTKRLAGAIENENGVDSLTLNSAKGSLSTALCRFWGEQPWSPLFLDWQITWYPSAKPEVPGEDATGYPIRGRSMMAPADERLLKQPMDELGSRLNRSDRDELTKLLQDQLSSWTPAIDELIEGGLLGQVLEGFHQALAGRDANLLNIRPNPTVPWNREGSSFHGDAVAAEVMTPPMIHPDQGHLVVDQPAPPATSDALPFQPERGGSFTVDHLWIIDDFGQWCDLLQGSSAGRSSGMVLHPSLQLADDVQGQYVAAAPRLLQPGRLNFRFTRMDRPELEHTPGSDSPIYGWVFYHVLDDALAICDASGRLLGELVPRGMGARWQAAFGMTLEDEQLSAFVAALQEHGALREFLKVMDKGLAQIRPSAARNRQISVGRPLALVGARLGLELFGEPWSDPRNNQKGSLPNGSRPLHLGRAPQVEDGLVGYYDSGFSQLHPAWSGEPEQAGETQLSFGEAHDLILLMEPHASVSARLELFPTKEISLPSTLLEQILPQLEISFRSGPVLKPAQAMAFPPLAATGGRWLFDDGSGPQAITDLPKVPDFPVERPVAVDGTFIYEPQDQ